jgi:hypothetical protein
MMENRPWSKIEEDALEYAAILLLINDKPPMTEDQEKAIRLAVNPPVENGGKG